MATEFQLSIAIDAFVHQLSSAGTITSNDSRELKSHLYDTVQMLQQKGLTAFEAFEVAKIRLGNKDELIHEFRKVNGTHILNKEWVFIFIGIGLTILIKNILEFSEILIGYTNASGKMGTTNAALVLACIHLIILLLVVLIFRNGERISKFFKEKVFDNNIWVVSLFAMMVGLLTWIPLGKFLGTNMYLQSRQTMGDIIYDNRYTELIIRGTLPATVILSIFLSAQSVNKKLDWQTLFKANNYFYIFLLSLATETVAAMFGRMLSLGPWLNPIVFGLIIIACIVAFIYHNKNAGWFKIGCFIAFPLGVELFASIYNAQASWISSPLFSYGIAIIISTIMGILLGIWYKKYRIAG